MKTPRRLEAEFAKAGVSGASVTVADGIVTVSGKTASWETKIAAGHGAAKLGTNGTVNDIEVEGIEEERLVPPSLSDGILEGRVFDVVVVGGGVVGTAIARELSKWNLTIALLEKEYDVAVHASSRNDGMIHDGFAAKPGTKKASYNVRGNRLWEGLARELGIGFGRPGSMIVLGNRAMVLAVPLMEARAKKNGVDGWEFWDRARVSREEPNVDDKQYGAFFLPSAGIVSPYKATVALAESAAMNGAEVFLQTCVTGFTSEGGRISGVRTNRGECRARAVVNAAGNWADVIADLAGDRFFTLHTRRGTDMILDVETGRYLNHIMGRPPLLQAKSTTKGGGLVKTLEGNVLVGPTAREAPGRENYATSPDEIRELERHVRLNKMLNLSQVITYFSGVRACSWNEDFIIERSRKVSNLVHAAGIQSPGLASAPAIAEDIAALTVAALGETMTVTPNARFEANRAAPPELKRLPFEERARLIAKNPLYGRIVCRCEEVSEGEIRDALASPIAVASLDSIKRRTRSGMGRCHAGFCTPRAMEIVADAKGIRLDEVLRKGPGSWILSRETKANAEGEGKPT